MAPILRYRDGRWFGPTAVRPPDSTVDNVETGPRHHPGDDGETGPEHSGEPVASGADNVGAGAAGDPSHNGAGDPNDEGAGDPHDDVHDGQGAAGTYTANVVDPYEGSDPGKDPLRFSNWMKRSATGAVMTGIAVGLKEALQPQKKEVPFVIEARGEPDDPDKPIDLHFDPDSPADTVAIIRRPPVAETPE
jgi:hypothetical protein